ncbi:MAG: BPSL0067 family protein [Azoarcus sp.]|jgi:hypothetical protein|nr:BPSL0067 family protein [Azoarcus sp.]
MGPYFYVHVESLVHQPYVGDVAGNNVGECVSLVKHYIPGLANLRTTTWIKGQDVIETIKNGGTFFMGTAIATFIDGRFQSGNGHAGFYAGHVNDPKEGIRIYIVEQYLHPPTGGIQKRLLHSTENDEAGHYRGISNIGTKFSVIL